MKEKVEYLKWSLAGDVRTLEPREYTAKTRLYNICHQLLTEAAIKSLDSLGDYVHHQGRHHDNNQVADEILTLL